MTESAPSQIVPLSSAKFVAACAVMAWALVLFSGVWAPPTWLIAAEVMATVLGLFIFGSIRYRLDKNALTYGAVLVIGASFWGGWWPDSALRAALQTQGPAALWPFLSRHFLSLHGLNELIHADTLLFILGLTFFVGVIAQTRLLETVSFTVLRKSRGQVFITVTAISAIVSFASGILDGVSMIGLMIRTLVIILLLSRASQPAVVYSVIISTVITTVCGMWLAYGEPPNLIMKANLHPYLDNSFFLRFCLPVALGSYFVVVFNLWRNLRGRRVDLTTLDLLDIHTADVRFLQAERHGAVLSPIEFVETHRDVLGDHAEPVLRRLHEGLPLGEALVNEKVPQPIRRDLMGGFIAEDMAATLDDYYVHVFGEKRHVADESARRLDGLLAAVRARRIRAQRWGVLAFLPFVGLLIAHAVNHDVPLFLASFAAFAVAWIALLPHSRTRSLALKEAGHEFSEYFFLIPLFFSITLLQKTGFFQHLSGLLEQGIHAWGASHVAFAQMTGATFLSAILDNNVVADFGARALRGLEVGTLHLFAMAQIAGYALGGCWTHVGSAQSVVAYSFIQREVQAHFTPWDWIKAVTALILEIFVFVTVVIYVEGWVLAKLSGG